MEDRKRLQEEQSRREMEERKRLQEEQARREAELSTCLNGVWREQYINPLSWRFSLTGNNLLIRRTDNGVSGTFSKSGINWVGQLKWSNGTTTDNVILSPTPDCKEIRTNQSWWYRR